MKDALARLVKRRLPWRQDKLMDQYKTLEPRVRKVVDGAVRAAKKWTTKSRDWIAIDIITPSSQQNKTKVPVNPFDLSMILFSVLGKKSSRYIGPIGSSSCRTSIAVHGRYVRLGKAGKPINTLTSVFNRPCTLFSSRWLDQTSGPKIVLTQVNLTSAP